MESTRLCVLVVLVFHFKLSSSMMPDRCSTQGDIRLEGGNNRVEVCNNRRWGAVCGDSGWDDNAATVACRQLGQPFTGAEAIKINKGGSPKVGLRIESCNGNEDSLFKNDRGCTFQSNCPKSVKKVAAVECRERPTSFPPTTQQTTTDLPPTTQQTTTDLPPTTRQTTTDLPPTTQQTTDLPPTTQQTSNLPPTTQQTTDLPPTTQQTTELPPTTQQTTDLPPTTQPTTELPPTTQQTTELPPTTQQTTDLLPTTQQTTEPPPTTQQTITRSTTTHQDVTNDLLTSGNRLEIDISLEFIPTTSTVTVTIRWRNTAQRSNFMFYEVQCTSVAERREQQDSHTRRVTRRRQRNYQVQLQGLQPNTTYSCCVSVQSQTPSQDVSNCTQLTTPLAQGTVDSFIILVIILVLFGLILVAIVIGWVVTCVVLRRRYGNRNTKSRQDLDFDNPVYHRNSSHSQQPDISGYNCNSLQLDNYNSVEPTYEHLHLPEGEGPTYDVIPQGRPGHNGRVEVQTRKNTIKTDLSPTSKEPQVDLIQDSENNTLGSAGEDYHLYHVLEVSNKQRERNEPEKTNKTNKDEGDHDYHILEDDSSNNSRTGSTHDHTDTRTNEEHTSRGHFDDLNHRGTSNGTKGDPQDYEMPIPTQKVKGEGEDNDLKH